MTQPLPVRSQWRRPLIAAAVTLVLAALALFLGYREMRDDADRDAAASAAGRDQTVRKAQASATAGANGARQPAPPVPLAAERSP